MSEFNPQIQPQQEPSYLKYSTPISQPSADTSLGTLFKGIGDVFETAVKGADFVTKDTIDKKVEQNVDLNRDAYTATLENATEVVTGKPLDITTSDPVVVPEQLDRVKGFAESLRNSAAAGKISSTYYQARILNLAKDLRNQYPGYRDYIDQKISEATGYPIANSYIKSILGDLNSLRSKDPEEKDFNKAFGLLKENSSAPGAKAMMDYLMTNRHNPEALPNVYKWVADSQRGKFEVDALERDKKLLELKNQDTKSVSQRIANTTASNIITDSLTATTTASGNSISDLVKKANEAQMRGSLSPEASNQAYLALDAQIKNLYLHYWKEMTTVKNGKTLIDDLPEGAKQANEIWDNQIRYLKGIRDAYRDKNLPLAATYAQIVADQKDEFQKKLMDPIILKNFFLASESFKNSPEFARVIATSGIAADVPEIYRNFIKAQTANIAGKPDPNTQPTLKAAVEDAQRKGVNDLRYKVALPRVMDFLFDPSTPDDKKINIANAAFTQGNKGFLELYPADTVINGRNVPGRLTVYQKLTSPAIADEIKRLSAKDPSLWRNYREWTLDAFANSLFQRDISDLARVQTDPNYQILWHSDSKQFEVYSTFKQPKGMAVDPMNVQANEENTRRIINRVNIGLESVSNVLEREGKDRTEAFLVNQLRHFGVDFENIGVKYSSERGSSALLRALVTQKLQEQMKNKTGAEKAGNQGQ